MTNTVFEVPRRLIFLDTESRMKVVMGGGRSGELVFSGNRISVGEDEKVLRMNGSDDTHRMNLRP